MTTPIEPDLLHRLMQELTPVTPYTVARAMLYHIKAGTKVSKLRVYLTHVNVHAIWCGNRPWSQALRKRYPLTLRMPKLGEPPEIIDCRTFTVPWDIALPLAMPLVPVNYPRDTGDPVQDFHPPHVEPLMVLDEMTPGTGANAAAARPSLPDLPSHDH